MTAMRSNETTGWVPEFEFEVWSLGIDCKKFQADCCRKLAREANNQFDLEKLSKMSERQELTIKSLSNRINGMIDNLLGDFYANGGQVLQGNLEVAVKDQVRECLNAIEDYEQKATVAIANQKCGAVVKYAEEQEVYYRQMFQCLADLYPEGEVKRAFQQLAEN